jgi:hypothetical protein
LDVQGGLVGHENNLCNTRGEEGQDSPLDRFEGERDQVIRVERRRVVGVVEEESALCGGWH